MDSPLNGFWVGRDGYYEITHDGVHLELKEEPFNLGSWRIFINGRPSVIIAGVGNAMDEAIKLAEYDTAQETLKAREHATRKVKQAKEASDFLLSQATF